MGRGHTCDEPPQDLVQVAKTTEAAQARMEAVAEAATTLSAFQGAVQNLGTPPARPRSRSRCRFVCCFVCSPSLGSAPGDPTGARHLRPPHSGPISHRPPGLGRLNGARGRAVRPPSWFPSGHKLRRSFRSAQIPWALTHLYPLFTAGCVFSRTNTIAWVSSLTPYTIPRIR